MLSGCRSTAYPTARSGLSKQKATRGRGEAYRAESLRLRAQGRDTPKSALPRATLGRRSGRRPARKRLGGASAARALVLVVLLRMLVLAGRMLVRVFRRHRVRGRRGLHALAGLALPAAEQLVEETHRLSWLAGSERRVSQYPGM